MDDQSKPALSDKARKELLDKAVAMLNKEFPFVQVIVAFDDPEDGSARRGNAHAGNFYARYGVVRDWVLACENGDFAEEVAKAIRPPDDEDESTTGNASLT